MRELNLHRRGRFAYIVPLKACLTMGNRIRRVLVARACSLALAFACSSVALFQVRGVSCWNSIEFMSNFLWRRPAKTIERYHTKAYVLPNAAKEAPLAATMLRLRADYRRQTQFQRTIKKELSTMALYTPEYQRQGNRRHQNLQRRHSSSARRRRRPHPRGQLR